MEEDLQAEEQRGDRHRQDTQQIAAEPRRDRLIDVEGHRLVLGFLEGVPGPQPLHRGMSIAEERRIAEHELGEDRGEVFERRGHGELPLRGHHAVEADAYLYQPLERTCRIPLCLEQLVVAAVLAPVDSFLTAESPHLLAQLSVLGHRGPPWATKT